MEKGQVVGGVPNCKLKGGWLSHGAVIDGAPKISFRWPPWRYIPETVMNRLQRWVCTVVCFSLRLKTPCRGGAAGHRDAQCVPP